MRFDPGPCPICGAAHTACTGSRGPIVIPQLPARDAAAALDPGSELRSPEDMPTLEPPPLIAELVQPTLPPEQVTTGTYRRGKRR